MSSADALAQGRTTRAAALASCGSVRAAVDAGMLQQYADVSLTEALVIGLFEQQVRDFTGVFGHGSTDLGEVLRVYQEQGAVRVYQVHSEIEASHAATMLYWQYGRRAAVFTSIGPGAMQALAASLAPLSLGAPLYYLLGDETTHAEGYNMQQIPRREQELFLKLTSVLGPSYSLHTPESVFSALRRGMAATRNPGRRSPFYMLMPMNTQPLQLRGCNLTMLPSPDGLPATPCVSSDPAALQAAVRAIAEHQRIAIKLGGGAVSAGPPILALAERVDAAIVHGPQVPGVVPASHPRNMQVGGSKGSVCGNFAMNQADLVIAVGARAVCQWDCSGIAWKKADCFIGLNSDFQDCIHYNRTIPLVGDAAANIRTLLAALDDSAVPQPAAEPSPWLAACQEKRREWDEYLQARYDTETLYDPAWDREILTQPAAIKAVCDYADAIGAVKIFDAGDVQANGFQIVADETPGRTYTDTSASYMGFAASAVLASAMVEDPEYPIAFSGDGSFLMCPQILSDAVEHGVRGTIVVFDNRRMGAISGLQWAQYGVDFATSDSVAVDYAALADAFDGVRGLRGGHRRSRLLAALETAHGHPGLAIVHVPVYCGEHEMGGLGAWGQWNVGNWCEEVQAERIRLGH